jgi:hypothetical protein
MDLSRYGPSVNPLAAALANQASAPSGLGGSGGYGSGPSSAGAAPGGNPQGMLPSIPGLPPGVMPLPPTSQGPAIGATGIPQIPSMISPGAAVAPLQGGLSPAMPSLPTGPVMPPALAPSTASAFPSYGASSGGSPFGFGSLQSQPNLGSGY